MDSRFFHHMTNFVPGTGRKGHLGKVTQQYPILPFLFFCLILFLCSCSSSGRSSGPSTGSISFTLHAPHNQSSAQLATPEDNTASISCTEWQVATVEAQTYDENNTLITQGGPWDCKVGQGTLTGVKPGTNRSVIIKLKNASGTVVLSGKRTNITVIAGQTADLGVIEVSRADEELPPVAANDYVSVSQGGSTNGNVLTNDTDPEGVSMTVNTTPVTPPGHGTLTLNADGTFSYTNDGKNITSDSFVYRVTDLYGGTATATVNITIILNWIKSFSTSTGGAESVIQTSDGGYVIAGSITSAATGNNNAVSLIKVDAYGTVVWNQTFGGTTGDGAYCVQQASDGGYIVAGYHTNSSGNATHTAALLIKTNASGNLDTSFGTGGQITFGGATQNDYARCVRQTSDGGYVISGQTYSYGSGNGDAWLIKTLANGTLDTTFGNGGMKTFASGSSGSAYAYSVQQISDGYIIAGSTTVSASTEAWLIKTDAAGTMSWNKTFNSTGASGGIVFSVQQTTDNGYIIAGESFKSSGGNDALLIKTDINGNLDTTFGTGGIRTFIGSGSGDGNYVQANSIQQTSDTGYVVAGYTGSDFHTPWLIKTDASGTAFWQKTYHGSGSRPSDSFSSTRQTSDGGYIICGATSGYTAALLIKTDADGNPLVTLTPGLTPGS
jgi:uncharacterized delta-60 repeat protein